MMGYQKLDLPSSQRRAMLRNLVTSLLKEERITTTEPRAKEINRLAEKMITLAKRGDLHARRQVMSYLLDDEVVKKLFDIVATKYADRTGGYTRIVKSGYRRGDAAQMVIVELV